MKKIMIGLAALTALTAGAITESISYSGKLKQSADAKERRETMTFTLYDSNAPTVALWSHIIPVTVKSDGSFYTELNEETGMSASTALTNTITEALAQIEGTAEIGLKMQDVAEFPHRQKLTAYARAEYAKMAQAAERVESPYLTSLSVAAGNLRVTDRMAVNSMSTASKPVVSESANFKMGGNGPVTVLGGVTGVESRGWTKGTEEVTAKSDMILTCISQDGAFNGFLLTGNKLMHQNANDNSRKGVRIVSVQAFGPVE